MSLAYAQDTTTTTSLAPENVEHFAFEAEVHKMLDIVVNSLYQNKDVFLRELISNASDALDKLRILALQETDTYKIGDIPLEIKISFDAENRTLTIRDTGVGMTKQTLIENLGTVARSGTHKFVEALKESGNSDDTMQQIGRFGVGFYSSFLVADRVTVASKNPTEDKQHVWESSNGASDFAVYEDPRGNTLGRGTEITLHLKEDAIEYADFYRLNQLAHHYSEFVTHPISLRKLETVEVEVEDETEETQDEEKDQDDDLEVVEDGEEKPKETKMVTTESWEQVNSDKAIWTRPKEEITNEEYQSFFHLLSGNEYDNSAIWDHFEAEGNINFKSILYIPEEIPPEYRFNQIDVVKGNLKLYVRRVLISDDFELMPKYLSFVRGVVDSDDLPLNVNRETLQETAILKVIRKKLVRKALDLLRNFAKESESQAGEAEIDADGNVSETPKVSKYLEWYKKFAPNLKLGVLEDEPNRGRLMKLLRFQTSKSEGKMIPLEEYVGRMKDWQKDIYVLGGMSVQEIEESAFLEPFLEKDVEVLYLLDPVDEYLTKNVRDFNDHKFSQISSDNIKLGDEDEDLQKRRQKAYSDKFKPLTKWLKKLYGMSVLRVSVAKRALGSAPAVVSASDYGNSANMERILRAQAYQANVDDTAIRAMKVMELNPRHPLVSKLLAEIPAEEETEEEHSREVSPAVIDAAWMLHDIAMLNSGFPIHNPKEHNKRLLKFLQNQFNLEDLSLEPEIDPPVEEDEPPEIDIDGMGSLNGLNIEDLQNMNLDDLDLGDMQG